MHKLILFGDSITAGATHGYPTAVFTNKIRQTLSDQALKIINRGVLGDDSNGALQRLGTDVLANNPDLVVIFFGTNDVQVPGLTERKFAENLISMVQQIGPDKCLLVTPGIVGPSRLDHRPLAKLQTYAKVVLKIATDYQLPAVNWYATARQHDSAELLQTDGLHYAPYAYDLLLEQLAPLLREKLKQS